MAEETVDAIVIGAGPNGLVAANALVDAGWDVLVLEANPTLGGAVRSGEVTAPGFVSDLFSAFYPLAAASPVIRDLALESHGLNWCRAPDVLAHVLEDGRGVVLADSPERTAVSVDAFHAGDGDAWLDLVDGWRQVRGPILDALFTPFPPIASVLRVLRGLGAAGTLDLARTAILPVQRLGNERFGGEGARLLLTGNAMHSDVSPNGAGSGLFGWLLCMLAQEVGFPVPERGAQSLADALAARLRAGTGDVRSSARVDRIEIAHGRAVGVHLAGGTSIGARHAVLADVDAPALYRSLVGLGQLPPRTADLLDRFHWDESTLKVNWALGSKVPWTAAEARGAGTVHLGVDEAGFADFSAEISTGRMPTRPFVLFGQMTTADPTRSPVGTESAWAYTHVPRPRAGDAEAIDTQLARVRRAIEAVASGFGETILAEDVQTPADLQASDSNLVGGAINAGTSGIHQQLMFRPIPGLGRPETPIEGLYLASASAHPGGGVHGACGWNAARAALKGRGALRRKLVRSAWGRLLR